MATQAGRGSGRGAVGAGQGQQSRGIPIPGGLGKLAPPPTPEAAAKHVEDNVKRLKMLRDAYDVKHQRLVKQTQHLSEVKRKLDEVDSLVAKEIDHIRTKIDDADHEVSQADKEVARIEELFKQACQVRDAKLEKKRLLTEHLCVIISETEKEKSQKLANLYRQLEFEEMELKEARKDLVAAIAEEARRSNETANLYARPQQPQPRASLQPQQTQVPQQNGVAPQHQTQQPPLQPPHQNQQFQHAPQSRELVMTGGAGGQGEEGLFSGITSWGGAAVTNTVGAVTNTVGAVTTSLIASEEGGTPPGGASSSSGLPGKGMLEEDENDIPMDKLFEGFSPEDVNDLLK